MMEKKIPFQQLNKKKAFKSKVRDALEMTLGHVIKKPCENNNFKPEKF